MSDVAVIMGSDSDWPIMEEAAKVLDEFGISYTAQVLSAHRMPTEMVASLTSLPVIGAPVALKNLDGMDSLLSIVQMPAGVPVATVGIDNAKNAALLAARILGISNDLISKKVSDALTDLNTEAKAKGSNLEARRNQKTGF